MRPSSGSRPVGPRPRVILSSLIPSPPLPLQQRMPLVCDRAVPTSLGSHIPACTSRVVELCAYQLAPLGTWAPRLRAPHLVVGATQLSPRRVGVACLPAPSCRPSCGPLVKSAHNQAVGREQAWAPAHREGWVVPLGTGPALLSALLGPQELRPKPPSLAGTEHPGGQVPASAAWPRPPLPTAKHLTGPPLRAFLGFLNHPLSSALCLLIINMVKKNPHGVVAGGWGMLRGHGATMERAGCSAR